jgi:hypothetical protein
LDARSPQGLGGALTATGGTLGSALGGVGSLLGGLVGGVGGLLGNTVAGVGTAVGRTILKETLKSSLANALANLVGYKPAPKDAPPVQVPPQPPQPQGPTSLQTIGGDIVCHHWPDRITAFGRRERIVNSQTGPVIPRCWSPPDFVGAPEGDSNWIGVSHDATDKCFVSVKDVANGEAIRATLPKCDRKTKHYIGTLGPQYIDNSYCYKTPYLDETQSQIGAKVAPAKEGSFFDVLCFTNGGRYSNEEDS